MGLRIAPLPREFGGGRMIRNLLRCHSVHRLLVWDRCPARHRSGVDAVLHVLSITSALIARLWPRSEWVIGLIHPIKSPA